LPVDILLDVKSQQTSFLPLTLSLAFLCPLLFIPMNVRVLPTTKLICEVGFLLFLMLAGLNYVGYRK